MNRGDKTLVIVTLVVSASVLVYCLLLLLPWYHTAETALSPRTRLVEKQRIRFLPTIIGSDLRLEEQELLLDGKVVWSARNGTSRRLGSNFHVSPNERFVAFDGWLHAEPIVILDLETGEQSPVRAPQEVEESSHYYQYPFTVSGWSEDSAKLFVEVTGSRPEFGPPGGPKEYRETWQIDRETGLATRKR